MSTLSLRSSPVGAGATGSTSEEVIRHWEHLADRTHPVAEARHLLGVLVRAGALGEAAELLGALRRSDITGAGDGVARLGPARAAIVARLGAARCAELEAAGAALDLGDAAARAQQFLAALGQDSPS